MRLSAVASSSSVLFPSAVLKETDRLLAASCGGECVNTFRNLLPDLERYIVSNTGFKSFLNSFGAVTPVDMSGAFKETEKMRLQISTAFAAVVNNDTQPSPVNATTAATNATLFVSDKTPCSSAEACAALERDLNACTGVRQSLLESYESSNKIVGALASVLRLSCACIFEGPVTVCALSGFFYTCSAWFSMYRGIFSMNTALWMGGVTQGQACSMAPLPHQLLV
jgi:hypothetical protein